MIDNNNIAFVEKVLEDIPEWLQIIRSKEKKITPHEIYLIRKIRSEVEIILAEREREVEDGNDD